MCFGIQYYWQTDLQSLMVKHLLNGKVSSIETFLMKFFICELGKRKTIIDFLCLLLIFQCNLHNQIKPSIYDQSVPT